MEKTIAVAAILIILVITSGITVYRYIDKQYEIECIKLGGSIEQTVGRYTETYCSKK